MGEPLPRLVHNEWMNSDEQQTSKESVDQQSQSSRKSSPQEDRSSFTSLEGADSEKVSSQVAPSFGQL
jgi:hypothetical protein